MKENNQSHSSHPKNAPARHPAGRRFGPIALVALLALSGLFFLFGQISPTASLDLPAQTPELALRYVAQNGTGSPNTCLVAGNPCSLARAMVVAQDGDEVRVAGGAPYLNTNLIISRSILLSGGYYTPTYTTADPALNPSILDGGGSGTVLLINHSISPTVEGFHIRNGLAQDGAGVRIDPNLTGGGNNGNPTLRNNQIYDNLGTTTIGSGAGIYIGSARATIEGNRIFNNQASTGAGIFFAPSLDDINPTPIRILFNEIDNNDATGGTSRTGGGIYANFNSTFIAEGNDIHSNAANDGGGMYVSSGSHVTSQSNLIYDNNVSNDGGGLYIGGEMTSFNNTLADNHANSDGGGIYLSAAATAQISNTIVTSNTANTSNTGIYNVGGAAVSGGFNNIYNNSTNAPLPNQVTTHPRFINYAANNFHLSQSSNNVDAGDPNTSPQVAQDIDMEPRPFGPAVDIGADEFYPNVPAFSFAPVFQEVYVDRGTAVTYTHSLTNENTTDPDSYTFTCHNSQGWALTCPASQTLPVGGFTAVDTNIVVPPTATALMVAITTITATSQVSPSLNHAVVVRNVVNPIPNLEFSPNYSATIAPGTAVTFTHRLTNTGDAPDTFHVTIASDTYGWGTLLPNEPLDVPLAVGGSADIQVRIDVPPYAASLPNDTVIRAESGYDPAVFATVTDTVRALETVGTRYVSTGGTDLNNNCTQRGLPCRTVGHAIEQAVTNDEVRIAAGNYPVSADIGGIPINETLHISGGWDGGFNNQNANPTTLYPNPPYSSRIFALTGASNNSTFNRLTLQEAGTGGARGGAVWIGNNVQAFFEEVTIRDSQTERGGAVHVSSSALAQFDQSRFINNTATFRGGAIHVEGGTVLVRQSRFISNTTSTATSGSGGGAFYMQDGLLVSENNLFDQNTAVGTGAAFYLVNTNTEINHNTLNNNSATGNGGGLYVNNAGQPANIYNSLIVNNTAANGSAIFVLAGAVNGNFVDIWNNSGTAVVGNVTLNNQFDADPLFADADFRLHPTSPMVDARPRNTPPASQELDTDFEDDGRPADQGFDLGYDELAGCSAKRDSTVYGSIQEAIEAPGAVSSLIMVSGICRGVHSISVGGQTLSQTVSLTGTQTFLIQGGWDPDFERRYINQQTIIDPQGLGRALYVSGPVSVTLEYFTIRNGDAAGLQGGPSDEDAGGLVYNQGGQVTLRAVSLLSGTATLGGGYYQHDAGLTQLDLILAQEPAFDMTPDNAREPLRGTWSQHTAVTGGAMYVYSGTAVVNATQFYTNSASNGGAIYNNTAILTATNSVLAFNSAAQNGGGLANTSPLATNLLHLTVVSNTAVSQGGGIYNLPAANAVSMRSSIFQGNDASSGDAIHADAGTDIDYNYYHNQANPVGGGAGIGPNSTNSPIPPGLINPASLNFHLQNVAAAADTGDPASPLITDFDLNPRPSNQGPDMGADEVVGCLAELNGTIYGSIQAALTAAQPGDTIRVAGICSGVHDYDTGGPAGGCRGDNGIIQTTVHVDKNVILQGGWDEFFTVQGEDITILDAAGLGRVMYIAPGITATVESFHMINGLLSGSNGNGAGICIDNAEPTIRDNHLISHTATNGGAIYTINSPAVIEANRIYASQADDGAGLYATSNNGTAVSIWNNFIYNNTATQEGGAYYNAAGSHRFWHNTVVANQIAAGGGEGAGVYVAAGSPQIRSSIIVDNAGPATDGVFGATGSTPSVTYNDFFGQGTNLGGTAVAGASNNLTLDPLFTTSAYTLTFASPVVDQGDPAMPLLIDFEADIRPSHQGFDIGADEIGGCLARIVGDPTNTIYGSAQLAVDQAQPGDTIQVDGVCRGVNTRSNSSAVNVTQNLFLDKSVTIDGDWNSGMLPISIFTATLNAMDNGRVVYIDSGVTVTITNIRLIGGDANGAGVNNHGGGVYNAGTLNLVDAVEIRNNTAVNGGGIYNTAVLTMRDSKLLNNIADNGGGFYNNGTNAQIGSGNRVAGNSVVGNGGGIYQNNGTLLLDSNRIYENSAPVSNGGGVYLAGGTGNVVDVRNNFIYRNSGFNGGGLYNHNTNAQVWHNTFYRNTANNANAFGAGIYANNTGQLTIRNNIIDFHTGSGIHLVPGGAADTDYNDVVDNQPNYTGAAVAGPNDISEVPDYVGETSDNFHLDRGSPGADVGDMAVPFDYDIDGDLRPTNGGPDMGADEINSCLIRVIDDTQPGGPVAHIFGVLQDAIDFAEDARFTDDNLPTVEIARGECTGVQFDSQSGTWQVGSVRRDLRFEGSLRRTDFVYVGDYNSEEVGTVSSVINAEGDGRAIYIHDGADPFFIHLAFVQGDAINGQAANQGGGVYVPGSGSTRLQASFVCASAAGTGGGMYLSSSSSTGDEVSDFTGVTVGRCTTAYVTENESGGIDGVRRTTWGGNTASGNGGGMYSAGPFDMRNMLIRYNTAAGTGGGLHNTAAGNRIINGVFFSNTAQLDGGGLFNSGANLHLYHNNYEENSSLTGSGGGVRNESSGFILNSSIVYSNTAAVNGGGVSMPNPPSEPGHTLTYNNFYNNMPNDSDTTTGVGSNHVPGNPYPPGQLFYHSPVIDEADPSLLDPGVPPPPLTEIDYDIRLYIRPDGGTVHNGVRRSDIGAYEWWKDFGCRVTPTPQQATAVPGTNPVYYFNVTNTGYPYPPTTPRHGFTDTITVTLHSTTQNWSQQLDGGGLYTLGWNESVPVTLTVSVPATATNGTVDLSTIRCRSTAKPERFQDGIATTSVGLVSGLIVYPPYQDTARPGDVRVYTHTVQNIGNDLIDVVIVPDAGMQHANAVLLHDFGQGPTTTLAITTTLDHLQTFEVLLQVTILDTALRGEFANPGVIATQADDSSNEGAVQNQIRILGLPGDRHTAVGGIDAGNNCLVATQPCATIQHAIFAAEPDDRILVAGGLYQDTVTRTVQGMELEQNIFIDKPVTIIGGYSTLDDFATQQPITRPTRLDGQGQHRVVYVAPDMDVTLSGLFIENGNADPGGTSLPGGGIYNAGSNLVISGTFILSNTTQLGAGIYHLSQTLHVQNSVLAHNTDENTAGISGRGAGIYLVTGTLVLENSTLVDNFANSGDSPDGFGGSVYVVAGSYTEHNNIFSDNQSANGSAVYLEPGVTLQASDYNLYWNNPGADTNFITGTNSFAGDPVFLDDLFHIAATSAAKDTGTPGTVLSLTVDYELEPRIMGPTIDIGADERLQIPDFTFTPITATAVITAGTVHTYSFVITNTGDSILSHTLSMSHLSLPPGGTWTYNLTPTVTSNLDSGEQVTVTFTISGTDPGYIDETTITAVTTNLAQPISRTVQATTTVNFTPGVVISPSRQGTGSPTVPLAYNHVLTNTGTGVDRFSLQVAGEIAPGPGWAVTLAPTQTGYLAAGASIPFTVTVTPPAGAPAGAVHTVTVEAQSLNTLGLDVRDILTDTTIVTETRLLLLTPVTQTLSVPDNSTAVFTHTLQNAGNVDDDVSLTVTGIPAAWGVTVSPTTALLAPLDTTTVTVTVTVPANTGGQMHTAVVTATSNLEPDVLATAVDTTTVQTNAGVLIGPDYNRTVVPPITTVYMHTITNTGNAPDQFGIEAQSSLTWTTTFTPNLITLGPGLTGTVVVTVVVPANGQPDFPNTTVVTATSQSDPAVFDTATDITRIRQEHSLLFAPDRTGTADPGTAISYTHWLTNTGNGTDDFTFTAVTPNGWNTTPPADVMLGPGQTTSVTVRLDVPAGAAGRTEVMTVTATSLISPSVSASVYDTTTVTGTLAVISVTIEPDNVGSGMPGDTLQYQHTVTNIGDTSENFLLDVASENGWPTTVTPTAVLLAMSESAPVTVTVTIPLTAPVSSSDVATVTARSQTDQSVFDTALDTTNVVSGTTYGVDIEPDRAGMANAGDVIIYTHTVTNTGSGTDSFTFDTVSNHGWLTPDPPDITLDAGLSASIVVTLWVPAMTPDTTDVMTVTATSQTDPAATDFVIDTTTVTGISGTLGVLIEPDNANTAVPGAVVQYLHTITNTGTLTDFYQLTAVSSQGWVLLTTPGPGDVIPLAPGQSASAIVRVTVPAVAPAGTIDVTTVTVTSLSDGSVSDQAQDTTTVELETPIIYLPIMRKQSATPPPTPTPTPTPTNTPTPTPCAPTTGIDLIVTQIEVIPSSPGSGQPATLNVTIRNQGTTNVPYGNNFFLDLYVDRQPQPYLVGDVVWGIQGADLTAGTSRTYSASYTFSSGSHLLWAQVDTDRHVNECPHENNNVFGPLTITVTGSPSGETGAYVVPQFGPRQTPPPLAPEATPASPTDEETAATPTASVTPAPPLPTAVGTPQTVGTPTAAATSPLPATPTPAAVDE